MDVHAWRIQVATFDECEYLSQIQYVFLTAMLEDSSTLPPLPPLPPLPHDSIGK